MIQAHSLPSHGRRARFAAGALGTLLLGVAAPSFAYVQTQTVGANGAPVLFHWNVISVPVTVYPNDMTTMTADEVELASSEAAAAWSHDQVDCTYLSVQMSASFDATHPAGSDRLHVLVFRSQWCDPEQPAMCQREALAVTSVFAGKTTGIIQDADIEVNTENFVWGDLALHPANGEQDLQNALTHEMGHLVGLDHNCFSPGFGADGTALVRQIDNTGAPVPDCTLAPPAVRQATMFNSADLGDLSKRTLEADDRLGVCDIYPLAHPPDPPLSNDGCGCRISSKTPPTWPFAPLLLMLFLTRKRSRSTRPRRRPRK
jgi:hypothetical protein